MLKVTDEINETLARYGKDLSKFTRQVFISVEGHPTASPIYYTDGRDAGHKLYMVISANGNELLFVRKNQMYWVIPSSN